MDDAIGELVKTLRETGQDKNTLIVFQSDNGGAGNGGNALRGQKSTMWEGGLRVPFVAWWPGQTSAGVVTDEFLTTLELAWTLPRSAAPNRRPT